NQRLRSALLEKALFDSLTGLRNRHHLDDALHTQMNLAVRNGTPLSCLMIDIDHFKTINDTWGHDVGDEAIVAITRQLQLTLRAGDYIGRFGGDEFAVIMSGTPADNAIAAMARVHERLVNMP
ncbi:diguanylate cyclase, partial [Klebsiella pneumoniae]|nr:diguanylate cyclase [Klebsiella pneumoniae]